MSGFNAYELAVTAALHLFERNLARFLQFLLVGGGAAADDVTDAGEEIAEDVGADDGLAGDDALVGDDLVALDAVGGCLDHDSVRASGSNRRARGRQANRSRTAQERPRDRERAATQSRARS